MADYIFTQNGDGNVQIADMTGMPHHVNIAFKWALEHNYQSVAAQYARTLALEVERLREDNGRTYAALKLAQARAADMEAEVERLRAENDAYKADIEAGRLVPFTCDGCEREYQRDGICYDCYRGEMDMYSARAALEGGQHAEDDH